MQQTKRNEVWDYSWFLRTLNAFCRRCGTLIGTVLASDLLTWFSSVKVWGNSAHKSHYGNLPTSYSRSWAILVRGRGTSWVDASLLEWYSQRVPGETRVGYFWHQSALTSWKFRSAISELEYHRLIWRELWKNGLTGLRGQISRQCVGIRCVRCGDNGEFS